MSVQNRDVPGPKARAILKNDNKNIGSAIYIRFFPMVVKEGNGIFLKDVDGFEYLDFCAGWCVCGLGYKHPKIYDAISKQLEKIHFVSFTSFSSPPVVELAEKLVEKTPGSFKKKAWFGINGIRRNGVHF